MTRDQAAAKVAQHKALHPEKFCPVKGCLWRIAVLGGPTCQRHPKDLKLASIDKPNDGGSYRG